MISVSALSKKFWREAWQLRGQILSIALVVSTGVMSVIVMRGSYDTLVVAQADYYRDMRFASVWSLLVRAPQSLTAEIEAIPGVNIVASRPGDDLFRCRRWAGRCLTISS